MKKKRHGMTNIKPIHRAVVGKLNPKQSQIVVAT